MNIYQEMAGFAAGIERELRTLGGWQDKPIADTAFDSERDFFTDTMTFFLWLQFVLVPRILEIVETSGEFPPRSDVAAHAVRELDGAPDVASLIQVLTALDHYIGKNARLSRKKAHRSGAAAPRKQPSPPANNSDEERGIDSDADDTAAAGGAPVAQATPLQVTESYWRTRDQNMLHPVSRARSGPDTWLAESVFKSVSRFLNTIDAPEIISDGVRFLTLLEAERGPWIVYTVLCAHEGGWRIDLPLSIQHTAALFLKQRGFQPLYTDKNDARGRAMQFWQSVTSNNASAALDKTLEKPAELPEKFAGLALSQMDEVYWFVGEAAGDSESVVRVLINRNSGSQFWDTRMVKRAGEWLVDLTATLVSSPASGE
jgi:uncharacterized protein YqcC (DUF446 family)